jgi:predicted nuclease of predicted toxin-antitoxin system
MRFLLDANMPRSAVDVVTKAGHQVEFVRDVGLGAAPDSQIADHARQGGLAVVTRDLDFSDVRQYSPELYAGIVVLRLPDHATAAEISDLLARFLAEPRFVEKLHGRLAIVDEHRVRFRPPLE